MSEKINSLSSFQKVVFAAMSKRTFYLREHIVKFILEKNHTPSCAFMMFSYFLLDTVARESLIEANNELIRRCDELWVFGEISDGVEQEMKLARTRDIPIRFFEFEAPKYAFKEIAENKAKRVTYK
jgi:hypothetical protein